MPDSAAVVDAALYVAATVLVISMVAGLYRAWRGPTAGDRIAVLLLLGTSGVALLVVLAAALDIPALRDAALVVVLLATVVVIVRIRGTRDQR